MSSQRELAWLRRTRDLVHKLSAERPQASLLSQILDFAMELTEAERGTLVTVEERLGKKPRLVIEEARGFHQSELAGKSGLISRTVVKQVLQSGSLVTSRADDESLLQVTSVQGRSVLSIIAAPLLYQGQSIGALYLDHRQERNKFSESDLPMLETFAIQAALALVTQREQQPQSHPLATQRPRPHFGSMIGQSEGMKSVFSQIIKFSQCQESILILGESGTGKELVARELHEKSRQNKSPFIAVNCAALPPELVESELFGHKAGAFTGANDSREGLFFAARDGTLFLDEIGELDLKIQSKLLRALQERAARPVGARQAERFHCRIIAATHRDLKAMVQARQFREDLYYRLDVLRLSIPPLRDRREDILPLFEHFSADNIEISDAAKARLLAWNWPGNIRELQNMCRRFLALGVKSVSLGQLPDDIKNGHGVVNAGHSLEGRTLGEVHRDMVVAALEASGGNKAWAARQLGIPRTSLYKLIKRFKIEL